jgi:hypothetical protein
MHALKMFALGGGTALVWVVLVGLLLIAFRKVEALARTPMLDVVLGLLSWIPWVIGLRVGGWAMLAGVVAGQVAAVYVWCFCHEMLHRDATRGPRIIKFTNKIVGTWRNHVALWVTVITFPVFLLIRLAEATVYFPLVWLLNFPRYNQAEWINVSRQKFSGLVGHDLIWCLYCDWMTGVYSLGAEMLRNVESFWCPIRFSEGKKCDNCKLDFPDIAGGWVQPDATMADVEKVLEQQYGNGQRAWFGHPVRLTVQGKPQMDADARG